MQVHHQRDRPEEKVNPEDFTAEDFIFPNLCKPGLGRVSDYCNILHGYR
jgi:hypothetical protein